MVADGDVFVVGEERLVGTEELTNADCVVDGGVEVGVVGDVDWFNESGASDGVERPLSRLPTVWLGVGAEEPGEGLAK